jgi:hypothetical protein
MRRFLILALAVILVISLVGVSAGAALAKSGPYLPGDSLFTIQYFAEQQQVRLQGNLNERAEQYLALLERRLVNLVIRTGTAHELESLLYLDGALDQSIRAIIDLPEESAKPYVDRLLSIVALSDVAVHRLSVAPTQNPKQVASFSAKLSTIRVLAAESQFVLGDLLSGLDNNFNTTDSTSSQDDFILGGVRLLGDPMSVPFPSDSPAVQHDFYPLVGKHALLECEDCHSEGVYDGTPTWCEACHADDKPTEHYPGDCVSCHIPESWEDAVFDHALATTSDCVVCHANVKPANHYGSPCAACHNTNAWTPADFNHKAVGATNCVSCHSNEKPANHYDGQCSNCHNTDNWHQVNFNHSGLAKCKSCHNSDKPDNHYDGQCSSCHNTDNWQNANFNHSGLTNCKSCHNGDKPDNHYDGQCSSCHNTDNWRNVSFNHNGQTDCKSCHSSDRPSGHYGGQCSQCHNTNDWDDANFNHSAQSDCKSCHSSDKPSGHFGGQCSQCHSTNDWDDANFNHSAQTDCKSCHSGDRPGDHSNNQCSQCHNQQDWDDADDDDEDGGDGGDGEDDEDDDDDDEDDEKGSTDGVAIGTFADTNPMFDCSACHQNSDYAVTSSSPIKLATLWRDL